MLSADGYYTVAVDMWSIGCIFAELLGRTPLFAGKDFMEVRAGANAALGVPVPMDRTAPDPMPLLQSISHMQVIRMQINVLGQSSLAAAAS